MQLKSNGDSALLFICIKVPHVYNIADHSSEWLMYTCVTVCQKWSIYSYYKGTNASFSTIIFHERLNKYI